MILFVPDDSAAKTPEKAALRGDFLLFQRLPEDKKARTGVLLFRNFPDGIEKVLLRGAETRFVPDHIRPEFAAFRVIKRNSPEKAAECGRHGPAPSKIISARSSPEYVSFTHAAHSFAMENE